MNQFVDALGKACPMPVILAKKEIDAGNTSFVVAVDNEVAVQNLQRLAESQGYQAQVQTERAHPLPAAKKPQNQKTGHCSLVKTSSATAPKSWALL